MRISQQVMDIWHIMAPNGVTAHTKEQAVEKFKQISLEERFDIPLAYNVTRIEVYDVSES